MNIPRTFANSLSSKQHEVDCDRSKLSREVNRDIEICNRARWVMDELEQILRNGPSEQTLATIEHDYIHLKNLLKSKFN